MKLGVFTVVMYEKEWAEALDVFQSMGIEALEIGTGNYPGNKHCDIDTLLADEGKRRSFMREIEQRKMTISALSCHGNPLHPVKKTAQAFHETWRKTVLLAEKLGVEVINNFSGCPGDCEQSRYPNWVVCTWPTDFQHILQWQWEEKLIPYWREETAFAKQHNMHKIALEMHPGFMVYNTDTLLKLRRAVGPEIGANFDPSHLLWQGMDPVAVIKALGREQAIFHVHAKDTFIDKENTALNGVLEIRKDIPLADKAWFFRSVGYGLLGEEGWKAIVSALRLCGYDYVFSIEHEDPLASTMEGLGKAAEFLHRCLLKEEMPDHAWWL